MKRKKKERTYLMIVNTPNDFTLRKLVYHFQTMLNHSANNIIFDPENSWCIFGIQQSSKNYSIIRRMVSNTCTTNDSITPPLQWLNLLCITVDDVSIKSIRLLSKCKIIHSASMDYIKNILRKPDSSLYYLRLMYEESTNLTDNRDLLTEITNIFRDKKLVS